jgi:hypothetical protein
MVFAGAMLLASLTFAGALCGETTRITTQSADDNAKGITVTGEGKVTAAPDVAMLTLGVHTLAPTVAEARDGAATALDAMVASMRANGIDEKDIQTQQLSIHPEYDYGNEQQTLRGFRVTNTVLAKVRNIDNTSKVVDDAVTAGGDSTTIEGIAFTIDEPGELQSQAREAAVRDARAKAETLASAAGVGLGDPIEINEGGGVQPVYYSGAEIAADRQAAAPTPIEPGELDVVINVSVTWDIS